MRVYADEDLSLEQVWAERDTEGRFSSIKTLYRYHRHLAQQLDSILITLSREITLVDTSAAVPDILPGQGSIQDRLKILFSLLDVLICILHQKHRSGILLQQERHSFLHYFFHCKAGILLCDSS